jgi:hypothetical protein
MTRVSSRTDRQTDRFMPDARTVKWNLVRGSGRRSMFLTHSFSIENFTDKKPSGKKSPSEKGITNSEGALF